MEIDVTHMVEDADVMFNLSGSVLEHGQDAGPLTWNNSVEYGREHPLLSTGKEREAARAHFAEYGWSREEIAARSDDELQAITCQDVADAIREMGIAEGDYDEYQRLCEEGICSSRLFRGKNGRWYFSLGL